MKRKKIELHLVHDKPCVLVSLVIVHSEKNHRLAAKLVRQGFDLRHGHHAPTAAAIPEIERNDFAPIIRKRMFLPIQISRGPVRSGFIKNRIRAVMLLPGILKPFIQVSKVGIDFVPEQTVLDICQCGF